MLLFLQILLNSNSWQLILILVIWILPDLNEWIFFRFSDFLYRIQLAELVIIFASRALGCSWYYCSWAFRYIPNKLLSRLLLLLPLSQIVCAFCFLKFSKSALILLPYFLIICFYAVRNYFPRLWWRLRGVMASWSSRSLGWTLLRYVWSFTNSTICP